jgi:hypothetical protein
MHNLKVDVYPVGWLADLLRAWRYLTRAELAGRRKQAWRELRKSWRYTAHQLRRRNWRAVKNAFNGYLAEPEEFPPGDYRRRCGTGWTKARALRSLDRRLPPHAAPIG